MAAARVAGLLAAIWVGVIAAVGLIAAPAAFAVLERADAGRLVGRLFAQDAMLSLVLAMALFLIERTRARHAAAAGQGSALNAEMLLALAALFCTVAGYYALQPMMVQARSGQGRWSFGTLHAVSTVFFGLKALVVATLAWRLSRPRTS